MGKFQVDIDQVRNSVVTIRNTIKQNDIEREYTKLRNRFSDSKGKEADALREMMQAERELVKQLDKTLDRFADSIQFAAKELQTLDKAGASAIVGAVAASNLTVRGSK